MTLREVVLRHFKTSKSITSFEAFSEYGITRLSAIIFDLRKKYIISDEWVEKLTATAKTCVLNAILWKEKFKMTEYEPTMDIVKEADKVNNIEIVGVERLQSIIERIERQEENKKEIQADIRDIYAEAKASGFDCQIIRKIIKLRSMNAVDRDEQDILIETYRRALNI